MQLFLFNEFDSWWFVLKSHVEVHLVHGTRCLDLSFTITGIRCLILPNRLDSTADHVAFGANSSRQGWAARRFLRWSFVCLLDRHLIVTYWNSRLLSSWVRRVWATRLLCLRWWFWSLYLLGWWRSQSDLLGTKQIHLDRLAGGWCFTLFHATWLSSLFLGDSFWFLQDTWLLLSWWYLLSLVRCYSRAGFLTCGYLRCYLAYWALTRNLLWCSTSVHLGLHFYFCGLIISLVLSGGMDKASLSDLLWACLVGRVALTLSSRRSSVLPFCRLSIRNCVSSGVIVVASCFLGLLDAFTHLTYCMLMLNRSHLL